MQFLLHLHDDKEYNLKNIKQDFKEKGIFYTPPELVEMMKSYITVSFDEVYDPTCGDGGLLKTFDDNIKKYGQEINEHQLKVAENNVNNFIGYLGDTLTNPGFIEKKFKLIMGNPPFSVKWTPQSDERFINAPTIPTAGRADFAFLLHILHYLDDEGQAIVLQFPGVLYRGNREKTLRKYFIEKNYIERVVHIPENTFVDTKIATALIVFRKNKTTTDIIFEDKETDKEIIVPFDKIKENDFNLSVNSYIPKEEVKITYDPIELQKNARKEMILRLKKDIETDIMICELEKWDYNDYLSELIATIKEYIK